MNQNMFNEHAIQDNSKILSKVLRIFGYSLVVSAIGAYCGQFIPPILYIPLIIAEFIILLIALFARKKKVGYFMMYLFTFISGMTMYPILVHYLNLLSGEMVAGIFLATAILFTFLGTIGYRLEKNLQGWGKYLLIALIALVILSIVAIFIPFGNVGIFLLSLAGVIIFSLYSVYDFNQMKHGVWTERDVPMLVLNIYLDFLNLFLDLLRLAGLLSSDD